MDRRDFMKMCSVAGLGVAGSTLLDKDEANAQDISNVQLFVAANMGGGPDIRMSGAPFAGSRGYTEAQIGRMPADVGGEMTWAPDFDFANTQTFVDTTSINTTFFTRFFPMMTVIRGIDQQTNGHDTGQCVNWSGRLTNGTAAFGAIYAAHYGKALPLAYVVNGGYSETAGLVGRANVADADNFARLVNPNQRDPQDPNNTYFTEETWQRVQALKNERLARLKERMYLPYLRDKMNLLYLARTGVGNLKKMQDYLPEDLGDGMQRQVNIILAAYLAGLTVSATIGNGGYDTHGDNNNGQAPNWQEFVAGVTFLYDRAAELGIGPEKITTVIGGDFCRTPNLNDAQGTDHHGASMAYVITTLAPGRRVLGAFDDGLNPIDVDPATALPGGNVTITQAHVHTWLRQKLGVADSEAASLARLDNEEDINFG
jgi:hypothetical protein